MFNVGDEVLIKGKIAAFDLGKSGNPYWVCVSNGMGYWLSEWDITDKTYEQGLADAWELAKKIVAMGNDNRDNAFGYPTIPRVMEMYTAEEALAKIEAYEREKKFCVGDEIVTSMGETFIILALADGEVYGYSNDGKHEDFPVQRIECYTESGSAERTGKHIDIEGLLKQIGE